MHKFFEKKGGSYGKDIYILCDRNSNNLCCINDHPSHWQQFRPFRLMGPQRTDPFYAEQKGGAMNFEKWKEKRDIYSCCFSLSKHVQFKTKRQ